ncbi:hypothetical protein [Paenisporosarcina sp.]|uniref:hypothetical protein n=1 Tax=Paenisporosarcina sp. TaxID=1932001 RepID=UPI003C74A444
MGLFRMLFSKHKCLVYTAFGNDNYYKVVGKLSGDGVSYETVSIRSANMNQYFSNNDFTQYDIYVKEVDKHKAQQAIRR